MRNKNSIFGIFFGLFAVIGIIFFAVGIFIAVLGNKFKRNAVEVNAVISEIESWRDSDGEISHNVYVSYSYNGREYKDVELNEYGSNMYEGKEILIMIDPDSPRSLRTNLGIYLGPAIFMLVGGVFACIGIIPLIRIGRKSVAKKQIIASGQYICATVESIQYNKSYTVNGEHPFVVYCTYRDDYKDIIYRFKSENIWTNPEYVLHPGDEIKVYVAPGDYKNYHVDVESILQGKVADYT